MENSSEIPTTFADSSASARPARDAVLWSLFAAALLINLALFIFLAVNFGALPPNVPMHFDLSGQPDRVEPTQMIFALPIIGLIVIVGNLVLGLWVRHRERAAALLLTATAVLIQILIWLATINIVFVAIA
jgi:uncharacterized membrane protein